MFALPIGDDNPATRPAFVTWILIGLCVAVWLWQASLGERPGALAIRGLGFVPAALFGSVAPDGAMVPAWVPAWASLFTAMFLHGGLLHLLGNMLYLWIFGNNVEDAMGHGRFLVFYLLCGVAAALLQGLGDTRSQIPMIGASGAIAGVLGAYLLLHPAAHVRVFVLFGLFMRVVPLPASLVLGLWFAMQLASGLLSPPGEAGVAFWAHVGGFLAGLVLIPLFRRPTVPLLEPARTPWGMARERNLTDPRYRGSRPRD
jgi:membrane associated rhomboid family serine protease